ncbi:hypothetical protein I41_18180 [Lacipirellula limnantheis]|uniref:Leucine Rich repeats (2 copies) n=1 Tax=Lacipirellula limnantheis TaxID=2528024 RepID=A0A517TW91_9BACT|nr:hypothetical protein I41_18180 [Lacipirellula limnantheis]
MSIGYLREWDRVNDRFSGAGPPGPAFLRELFGEHFFLVPDIFIVDKFHGEKEALALLTELPTLTGGGIVDTPIGDEIIPILTQLHRIEDLSLYGTKVTDRGILRLTELPRLKNLIVSKTLVTEEGVHEFQRRCPDCVVHRENDDSDE